jgi:4-hydroxy-4-methyl-2-oxoglutarate aldolase
MLDDPELEILFMIAGTSGAVSLVARFSSLGSSSISDALDRLGIAGQPVGIRPLVPDRGLCGPAFTVSYIPVESGTGETVGDFIDDVPPGSVVVIDNRGRLDVTVWGDLMTTVAVRNGLAGTVIDGVCRDTPRARQMRYPIYSRGSFMRTGKDRVTVAGIGVPVDLADRRVNPGDILFGDADGLVIVPARRAEQTLEVACQISDAEDGIRELLGEGLRLADARSRFGYHRLQAARDLR